MGNLRETQQSAEAVAQASTKNARVTQLSVEVVRPSATIADMNVTQENAEVVSNNRIASKLRDTQLSAEVVFKNVNFGLVPIPIEWQPPSALLNQGKLGLCQRFYIDINTSGQNIALVILVDDVDYPQSLILINTPNRQTVEVPFQVSGRVFSMRLTGNLMTGPVEWFESWADIEVAGESKLVPLNVNANNRLWLAGSRNQMPEGTLRRAVGVAPELTGSVLSRWGSIGLYPVAAISVFKWQGKRYSWDGMSLFLNGNNIQAAVNAATGAAGGNGTRLTFVSAPPQIGLPDYLFVLGGGLPPFKIDPSGNITLWGINAPPNGATAQSGQPASIDIDDMTSNNTANWTSHNTTLSFDSTADDTFLAGGCYELTGNSTPFFYIQQKYGSPQDWSIYNAGAGPISLQSDLLSVYVNFGNPKQIQWMWILVDVRDKSFRKDYYKAVIQIVPTTSNVHAADADAIIVADPGRWVQIAVAKSQFRRLGTELNLDWSNVVAIQLRFGCAINNPGQINLNGLQLYGGYPLGIGPAALTTKSIYQYGVTFGNSATGSDSNPNGMAVQPDGTVNPFAPFIAQGCALGPNNLALIPLATDPQVSNRKLWRTTAGGSIWSYLDTIPDNTTTTYQDVTGDLPGQPIIVTPWTANVNVATGGIKVGYKVDGGNGFWFKVQSFSGSGTTGATIPAWNIPNGPFLGDWVPWTLYAIGDWVNLAGVGYVCIAQARGSAQSPTNAAFWTAIGTTIDNPGGNQVVWAWGGLNAVRTLGLTDTLLYDNQPPLLAYGDVTGPLEGSLYWTQDATAGRRGYVYVSPPGRPESVGTFVTVSSDDDPMQKVSIWDAVPWALSSKRVFGGRGSYPAIAFDELKGGLGTEYPFTVVVAQNGIYYRGPDGIRLLDRAGSILTGFDALANILRGRSSENVGPFAPVWAALARNEVFFGDDMVTFALGGQSPTNLLAAPAYVWRILGRNLLAAYYEKDDDEILASFGGLSTVALYEAPDTFSDGVVFGPQMRETQLSTEAVLAEGSLNPAGNLRASQISVEAVMPNH